VEDRHGAARTSEGYCRAGAERSDSLRKS
jgi:hypothetical protein